MNEQLLQILENILLHLKASPNDSDWSAMSVAAIISVIEKEIDNIKNNRPVDFKELKLQFSPTSYLQETAMANNWSDEYLNLSDQFDEVLLARMSRRQKNLTLIKQVFIYIAWGILSILAVIILMLVSGLTGWGI